MSLDNLRHAQYDLAGVQLDDPQVLFRDRPTWTTEVSWLDTTTQTGAPIDTPKNVLFGVGGASPAGIVSMSAGGVITILKGGPLAAKNRFRAGRTAATGVSHIFIWAEVSFNGGASRAPFGNSVAFTLDAAADSQVFFDYTEFNLPTGTQVRQRFARSSTGSDFGDLVPLVPSGTLTGLGTPSTPSAQITLYKLAGHPYGA